MFKLTLATVGISLFSALSLAQTAAICPDITGQWTCGVRQNPEGVVVATGSWSIKKKESNLSLRIGTSNQATNFIVGPHVVEPNYTEDCKSNEIKFNFLPSDGANFASLTFTLVDPNTLQVIRDFGTTAMYDDCSKKAK